MLLLCTDMDFDFEKIEEFEWDKGNLSHILKHAVETRECEEVFVNQPFFVREDWQHSVIEDRFEIFGQTNTGRKLFIVFTVRGHKLRVISARDQSKKERRDYEKIKENSGS